MKYKKFLEFILFIIFTVILFLIFKNSYVEANNMVYIKNISVGTTNYGAGYIFGNIESDSQPKIIFKSTDGKIKKDVFVQKVVGNQYYFDRHLVEIDISKEYVFEITNGGSTSVLNLGSNKAIGTYDIYKVSCKNNKITVAKDLYEGTPTVTLKSLNIGNTNYGAKYVYGKIEYTELVNRKKNGGKKGTQNNNENNRWNSEI